MDRIVPRRPAVFPGRGSPRHGFCDQRCTERRGARAKALKGFGGRSVLEVVDDEDGDTYRAVYTVRFVGVIYVLHAFQKKSKKGSETPKRDIELIKARLKLAEAHYQEHYGKGARK